jgi:hypothetical protein
MMNAAFSTDDYPVDAAEVDFSQVFKQRFDGEKPDSSIGVPQNIDPRYSVLAVLYAHAPPDIWENASPAKFTVE